MDTKDRKEKQLTLIEFSEEKQAFNFNEDGQTPPREGWVPIVWMAHDDAARWTLRVKNTRENQRLTLEEVIDLATYSRGCNIGMTDKEVFLLGFHLTGELINALGLHCIYPRPTDEEMKAARTTLDLFARMLTESIASKTKASTWFDNDTAENVRRYFTKANDAQLIDNFSSMTAEKRDQMLQEAAEQPQKDVPFGLKVEEWIRQWAKIRKQNKK